MLASFKREFEMSRSATTPTVSKYAKMARLREMKGEWGDLGRVVVLLAEQRRELDCGR
jgi:hypothetical protein